MPTVFKPTRTDGQMTASVRTETRRISARLHYTTEPHAANKDREWVTTNLCIGDVRVSGAAPPVNASVWFVDLKDARGVVTSSELIVTTN